MANIFTKARDYVNARLDAQISDLQKSEEILEKAQRADGTYGRKGLMFEPFQEQGFTGGGLFKGKNSLISNQVLKQVSRRDPAVIAIVDTRASQVSLACKKPKDRFDMGFKLVPKDQQTEPNLDEIRQIEEYILNCGLKTDRRPEDMLTFDRFGYMVTQDFMRYGHSAIEKIYRNDKKLHSFLPIAAESIYYANKRADQKAFDSMRNTLADVLRTNDPEKDKIIESARKGDYEYVQVIEGQVVEGFTSEELIFAKFSTSTDLDLNGYCISPLERALGAVTSHLLVENHQRQFFSNGIAAKGLLVIQGDVTPNALRGLQAQWSQTAAGPLSAWKTPILSGIQGVQWVPLTSNNRDMEFAQYYVTLLTQIFACFGMDPEEAGYGNISKGVENKAMSESSQEWRITASRDRGLRPLLSRIESMMNEDILPAYNPDYAKKYHFVFVGLDADDKNEELQHLQASTSLYMSLDDARRVAEMKPLEMGGGMILNPLYLQTLRQSLPFGLFVEKVLGVKGFADRPDFQFVDNPSWFQWMQSQMQMMQQQAMAQAGIDPNAPAGGGKPAPKSKSKDGDDSTGDKEAAEQEAQAAAMQAQAMAVQQFMATNPELFKALNAKMDLAKSQNANMVINTQHIDTAKGRLMTEWNEAAEFLLKEVEATIAEELKDKK